MQVKVIALLAGHDGTRVHQAGEEFEIDAQRCVDGSDWFVPVDEAEAERFAKLTRTEAPRIAKANAEAARVRLQTQLDRPAS